MQQLIEFAGNHLFLVGSLFLLVVLVIVNELRLRAGGAEAAPADAVRLINDGAAVLDVRSTDKFAGGHIVGARNVPMADLDGQLEALTKLKDKAVLLCCDVGSQSAKAAAALRGAGFAQVHNLKGGLAAWQRENLPLQKGGKKKGDKG